MEQQIRYCTTSDGVRIAYAITGEGPPVVRVVGWFSHLEYEWKSQHWRPLIEAQASQNLHIRYDGRGMGLSDREVSDFSLEAHVRDLEAVIDAAGIERFGLSGISQGGPTAITYAVRHPERVTHLVLYGSYACPQPGGLNMETAEGREQVEAMLTLMRHGWGKDTPAFRQMFTGLFMPEADADSIREFNEMQRASTSGETAAALFAAMMNVDVIDLLPKVSAPTLVIHRKGDGIVPFERGRQLATAIPGARFLPIEGNNHAILPHEPELLIIGAEIVNFTREVLEAEENRRQSASIESQAQLPIEKDLLGKVISHYRILEKLGEGGMGVVYKAEDTKLKRQVALKFLPPELTRSEEWQQRFLREARAAASLAHPNICTIHEIDETEGQAFIAMECIDGRGLTEIIESGPLDVGEAVDLAIQMAEGLQEAHEKGIIHRDIKAANIMVTKRGHARIMDFGIAKLAGQSRLTKTATVMGTVAYMSPEQAHGKSAIDQRTDIWSLGVVLYEMLTGRKPFDAPTDAGLIYKIVHEEPDPITNIRTGIPEALAQAIKKMMQKEPAERYENMEALISDLKAIRAGSAPDIVVKEKHVPSIAVLPFADMSPQKDQEYFCDGISESIINELTQIKDLRVIARTSAFSFKGQSLDVREIGKRLNVGTALEGSIQKAGDRIRVTAQLVNTTRGEHLWSEKYDRDMEDIFAIQDEITETIVDKLKPRLLTGEKAEVAKRPTVELEAYNLYLKGRYFWNRQSEEGLKKAIEYFEQAIDKEPDFAQAYAGLADAYALLPFYGLFQPREIYSKAKEAALKALGIDDKLVEAHVSLGYTKTVYEWDREGAENEFKRAIELNPGYAIAHNLYAYHLIYMTRFDEAIEQMRQAYELDPLSLLINRDIGLVFYFARRYDEAIQALNKTIEMDRTYTYTHLLLGLSYLQKSMYDEALNELQEERAVASSIDPAIESWVGLGYALMDKKNLAQEALNNLLVWSEQQYIPPFFLAMICFGLREIDEGFDWLEKAYNAKDSWLSFLKMEPWLDFIRSDPRYHAMLQKIGLEKSDAIAEVIEPSPSIAVLPFVNISADPEQEYFCDGLAEELINALTQIKDLHVVARTSAFSFKGQNLDVRDIGRKLNVETVLEGSVRKAGNRLRITGQLVKVSDGYHLWSEKYDRELEDIFAIQDEISEAIVDKLKLRLLQKEKDIVAKRQTVDIDAYNLVLRGLYFIYKLTEAGLKRGINYFEQAIELQPDYARAYAALADAYVSFAFHAPLPSKDFLPKAKEAAYRALELDDTLAEAHTSLAFVKTMYDWDWEEAEKEFKRAIELNPDYVLVHHWYALYLTLLARHDEAIREIKIAYDLDPFSLVVNRELGLMLYYIGQYDQAVDALQKAIEMNPDFPHVHLYLGIVYLSKSMHEEAIAEFEKEKLVSGGMSSAAEVGIAGSHLITGRMDEANKRFHDLLERAKQDYVSPTFLASACFAFGETDKGFELLDEAYQERDQWLCILKSYPSFVIVHSDPRYHAMLKKMNLDK